jgi:signal peptidase II
MNKLNSTKLKRMGLFFLCMILALLLDQWTKQLVLKNLSGGEAYPLIEGVLELQLYGNDGIAWSMLSGQTVFILFSGIIFLGLILFVICKLPDTSKFHVLYLLGGILTGGALGNMIDRIRLGYVIDFISFVLIHFPIFNVADMCIVISVVLLGLLFFFYYKDEDFAFLNFKQKKFRKIKEDE